MTQPRSLSALEAMANAAAGYLIAIVAQAAIFPAFGIEVGLSDHAAIAAAFTGVSLARSFLLRRVFNSIGRR